MRRRLIDSLMSQGVREFEILCLEDEGETVVGEKRNRLLQKASGEFSVFIDDDDTVSEKYLPLVLDAIEKGDHIDCVGFYGSVYFQGEFAGHMLHSVMCTAWTEKEGWYYRPPNHLNPIRSSIAKRFRFKPIATSEDYHWSLDLLRARALTRETFIGDEPLYHYWCGVPKKGL